MRVCLAATGQVILLGLLLLPSAFVPSAQAEQTLQDKIAGIAAQNTLPVHRTDGRFQGPGWDYLLAEGQAAQFLLLGEEHGIAENPAFASALFKALIPAGYQHFAVEVSPPLAELLDKNALRGLPAIQQQYQQGATQTAFFNMREEAQMLVDVRQSLPSQKQVIWGLDYEVLGDRYLISRLAQMEKPQAAEQAMQQLQQASEQSWRKYTETRNPQYIFSFGGDPALVQAVRSAWPQAQDNALALLHTLEETFAVNQLWMSGQGWASNERRVSLIKQHFLKYWHEQKRQGQAPKVLFKFGSTHMIRGLSMTRVFDLGNMLPEIAALEDGKSFHLLVLPGVDSATANFDPTSMSYKASTPKDGYAKGLELLTQHALPDTFTLIKLAPVRPLLGRYRQELPDKLQQVVHGFDAILIMSGSTPSSNLLDE
ncbi:hypothetical protein P2G88_19055 [Aliiglaciecola sp. CAU 1673]|uniref:hypothetical protein n=1 Tax=Aliiglaciecola sp. CAU 1673 TaxID=3032595 RepID=UPI0023DC85AB|nr:hypothetical protein [Aliiglaciecola sp. CAU 1673]MDF2180362.1 hypothetical protein [Aliiglaciecola sp. CAU 1673]